MRSFLCALVLTPILRDIFRSYNVVDRPGGRKAHAYPIPRLGGIAIAVAYLFALLYLDTDGEQAWRILPGAGLIFLTGILDDFFELSARYKLLGQIIAAMIAYWADMRMPGSVWVSFPVTILWLLFTTNSFNLIDGLNGLCSGLGLISTLTLFYLGYTHGSMELQIATLPLAGALLGFLCFNFSRATIFLGDSGALLVGFLIGSFVLLWSGSIPGETFDGSLLDRIIRAAPVMALFIPLLEVVLSVIRRFLSRKPIFAADRGHIHHRLLDRGLSPMQVVLVMYAWSGIGAVLGVLLAGRPPQPWPWVLGTAFVAIVILGIWQLRYAEFQTALERLWRRQEG